MTHATHLAKARARAHRASKEYSALTAAWSRQNTITDAAANELARIRRQMLDASRERAAAVRAIAELERLADDDRSGAERLYATARIFQCAADAATRAASAMRPRKPTANTAGQPGQPHWKACAAVAKQMRITAAQTRAHASTKLRALAASKHTET